METVRACLEVIWKCRQQDRLSFWALENPRGYLREFLGKPAFEFEQWQFGDSGVKPTHLWGNFTPPQKTVDTKPAGLTKRFPNGRTNSVGWSKQRSDGRAVTPPGFSKAFFKANP